MEGTSVGTHQLRHIAASHLGMRQQLKGSHHGVISHRAALYHYLASQVLIAMQFEHLVEAVLDYGVGNAGGDVGNAGALSEHLLHLRVHKYGAASAQVARSLRLAGELGEILYRVAHVVGKGLDEGSAARRTGLIELHSHHSSLLHEDGFHVLSADVEDETYVWHQRCGSPLVGHRLDNAAVEPKCGLYELFAIASGTRAHNL